MIKTKENVNEVLNEYKSFTYAKEEEEVSVRVGENSKIKMICDSEKSIRIHEYDHEEAVSLLYKDRKYINKVLFQ